ncbi:methyltransferase [Actinokineospora bangkokensis]|uniref:SAM-dependent methyltransferase n=1 Tax=Actinokineospora bangkokensis TaxID=1193682 RepID=A0A1Q9LNI2_9PSEU|nr:methyltransferase [Actinokineospora bangkokensis]OLR93602.1 SAM-dependent methyltransferase [Actinokineospora bangkokensis]
MSAQQELARMVDLATPFAVRVAVALRLPELVEAGTTDLAALAAAAGADRDALRRLLGHLTGIGFLAEPRPGSYALTEVSRVLLRDDHAAARRWLDSEGPGAKMDLAYAGMAHSVRTGRSAYGQVHGVPFWDDYSADEGLRLFFGQVMAAHAWQTGPVVAADLDWSGDERVLDVGGGIGALLVDVLAANPHLGGGVLDLPAVEPEATAHLAEAGLADRARFVPGSFFDPLPAGYDTYVISRVLTDWGDEDAARILRRAAEVVGGGRVLVVEVLAGQEHAKNNSSFDLQSLALLGGRERSEADFLALAAEAGFATAVPRRWDGGLLVVECRA